MIRIVVGPTKSKIIGEIEPMKYESLRFNMSYEEKGLYHRRQHNRFAAERKFMLTEKRMEFQSGLLRRVMSMCEKLDIEYEIEDQRKARPQDHFMPLRLDVGMRDYQQTCISAACAEMQGMIQMATGGGKTRVGCGIIAKLERNAIVLVHRLDLMHQFIDTLKDLMLYPEIVGRVGGMVYEPNVITVCTVQTICAALGLNYEKGDDDDKQETKGARAHEAEVKAMLDAAQVVILDEAHHAPARTIAEVMKMIPSASWRLGMSATDWRDDGADMLIEAAIGPRIVSVTLSDLVAQGWLVGTDAFMEPQAVPPGDHFDSTNWAALYAHYYTNNEAFHRQVLDNNVTAIEEGRHVLTIVTAVDHGRQLEALHRREGVDCVFLSGKDGEARRREVFDDVRAGRLRCLIGTSIADEGLDLPILDTLNLAAGGTSTVKTFQRAGRIMRPYEGKHRARIYDYRPRSIQKLKEKAGKRAGIYKREKLAFTFKETR